MIVYPSKFFDAQSTIECGQFFRYYKIGLNKYKIFSLDKTALVYTILDNTYIESIDDNYFWKFFDLDFDVNKVINSLSKFNELQDCINACKGIRILKQDLFETIISFIISSNNNIQRIKKIISNICCEVGVNKKDYFTFPTLNDLYKLSIDDFKRLGAGYRSNYLQFAIRYLKNNINILEKLKLLKTKEARIELMKITGIGYKVADCILLYGLHHLHVYPVDSIIFKQCKTETLNNIEKVRNFYYNRYGEYAGYAQQYIYHFYRNNSSEKRKFKAFSL